jgi:hypothetical protein
MNYRGGKAAGNPPLRAAVGSEHGFRGVFHVAFG